MHPDFKKNLIQLNFPKEFTQVQPPEAAADIRDLSQHEAALVGGGDISQSWY
ncbi:MAG: hypothetical protein ABL985_12035 [Casimicrobium sp.]